MAEVAAVPINYPEWTEYRKKSGLDPLGMQNTSVSLYQTFLPGISNVTLRIRYYGLYAWLCRTYAQKDGDTNPESWKRFIRRAEALYALTAYRQSINSGIASSGIAGIEWAQKAVEAATGDTIEFASAAEPGSETHYLKQAWGAYGAAYRSQLFEIGIFDESKDHELPIPSPEIGDRLATAFEDSIGDRGPLFYDVIRRGNVTKGELDRIAPLGASEISLQSAERALYQDLLLPADPQDAKARSRRLSVLLILKITALLGRDPKPDEVRWILYAGLDQKGYALEAGVPDLEAQRALWWVYHANDLCHIALETLLKYTLDTLAEHPSGITLARLIPLCVAPLLASAQRVPENWAAFVQASHPAPNAYASADPTSEWSLCEQIMRRAGRTDERVCPPETAWMAVRVLAILHRRVRDEGRDLAAVFGHFNPDAFRSLLTETRFLDLHAHEPFGQLLGRLLEERVVQRHLWVAVHKLRAGDYTFLIERDEGRLRLREKDGPVFTNPRLGPAITFLKDIRLVGDKGLTGYGAIAAGVS